MPSQVQLTGGNPSYQQGLRETLGISQLPPELEAEELNLSRRQQIADAMLNRGLQPVTPATSAGQFMVPMHWAQGLAQLGQALTGAYLGREIGDQRKDLAKRGQEMNAQAVKSYMDKTSPTITIPGQTVELQGPGAPVQPPVEPTPTRLEAAEQLPAMTKIVRAITGDTTYGEPTINRLTQPVEPPPPQEGPRPTMQEPDMTIPRSQELIRQAILEGMASQNPQVSALARLQYQDRARQEERETDRLFRADERALDRDLKREGIQASNDMRLEQMKNTAALTQMQIDSRERAGHDVTELKKALADQTAEIRKMEIASRERTAKAHDETLKAIAAGHDAAKSGKKGDIPTQALKMQQDELDAIGTAASINSDLGAIGKQVESGNLVLGPLDNLSAQLRNALNLSNESSRNFASFKATLERLRNDSLRLNKGVQTEGDSVRAWNELISNINDAKVVRQRLQEIQALNDRAVNIRKMNIDVIRKNYGAEPLDTSAYATQPPSVGVANDAMRKLQEQFPGAKITPIP